jgi:hypothetical protein
MNDGKADPAGRVVGDTMTLGTPRPGRIAVVVRTGWSD